jgi:ABC-2 type transport system ATP-binding protein
MIEAVGLTKRYASTVAVDDLSFTVPPGQVTGFLGPNGAGKSTTMRMIVGLDAPSAGTVTVDGRRYTELGRPLRHVGALLEARATHPGRTAYDHLLWMARSNGIPSSRVTAVLDQVGLRSVARKRVGGFSLGMNQRLGIAAALLGDPSVLLFDEPVNGLDAEGVHWVRTLLRSLAEQGRTILLSSHLMSEVALTADRLVIIGQGRLLRETTVSALVDDATGGYVRVRSPLSAELADLLTARGAAVERRPGDALHVSGLSSDDVGQVATANGVTLHELSVQQRSLEDVYLELTRGAADFRADQQGRLPVVSRS